MEEEDRDLRVVDKRAVADGVVTLTLADPARNPLPPWEPGAHVDLVLGAGMTRQYSLCGSPGEPSQWKVAVLLERESRGGSAYVHQAVDIDSTLRVRGPRNHFRLVPAERYLFVAGGIGITPILPMIAHVEALGADWRLLYGGRGRDSMAFGDELAAYGDRVELCPEDERGLLDLPGALGAPRDDTLVYCCGPEGLLTAVERRCATWPAGSLHVERFAPRAIEPGLVDRPVEVVLERSGLTLLVPAGRSILDVCLESGVEIPCSCEEGTCGTCETEIIEGVPEHRDSVLSDEERAAGETMMVCVSRALSDRLVLDR